MHLVRSLSLVASSFVVALSALACGGGTSDASSSSGAPTPGSPTPAGPPAPTVPADALRTLATAYCEGMTTCCTKLTPAFDAAACVAHGEGELRAELASRLVPNAAYDASRLEGCAAALRARAELCIDHEAPRTCGLLVPDSIRKACDGLVHGTLGDNAACTDPAQCVSGYCYSRTEKPGTALPPTCAGGSPSVPSAPTCLGSACEGALQCVVDRCEWPAQAAGTSCSFDDQCGDGSFCSRHAGNTCQVQAKAGETCWDFSGTDCAVGYVCVSAGGVPPGTCQVNAHELRGSDPTCTGKGHPYLVDATRCAALTTP